MTDLSIPTARDAAQQMVTCPIHGDRSRAVDIAAEFPDALVLALVLADLAAYTHTTWGRTVGMGKGERAAVWATLMADIEEWRLSREAGAA